MTKKPIAIVLPALLGACCFSPPRIAVVSPPRGVFTRDGNAVSFRVSGSDRMLHQALHVPWRILGPGSQPFGNGSLLIARSGGRTWNLSHSVSSTGMTSDLVGGIQYTLVPRPTGHLRRSYEFLARVLPYVRNPPRDALSVSRICHRILCAPDILDPQSFRQRYPEFAESGIELPNYSLGGWPQPNGDICSHCLELAEIPWKDLVIPTKEWLTPLGPCQVGDLLLRARFDKECAHAAPSRTLPGPPSEDRLEYEGTLGNVVATHSEVMASKALHLTRGSERTRADFALTSPAAWPDTCCLAFRAHQGATTDAPMIMSIVDAPKVDAAPNHVLAVLVFDGSGCTLVSGDGLTPLPGSFASNEVHEFHFDIDLRLRRLVLAIDGEAVSLAVPFVDHEASSFSRIRFDYAPAILEFFEGDFWVDDVRVRKTTCLGAPTEDDSPPTPYLSVRFTDLNGNPGEIIAGAGSADTSADADRTKPITVELHGHDPEGLESLQLDYDITWFTGTATIEPLLIAIESVVDCPVEDLELEHVFTATRRTRYEFRTRANSWLGLWAQTGKITINAR